MKEPLLDSRRRFLKIIALGTAYSTLATRPWVGTVMADVRPVEDSELGKLRIKISDFPALKNINGSVRLGGSSIVNNFPLGLYPIIINRETTEKFHALNARCSHEDCAVRPYVASARVCTCPCHNSAYGIDGSVVRGPATFPLISYDARLEDADTLVIEIPEYAFAMNATVVATGGSPAARVKIEFYAQPGTSYEILFRKSFNDAWAAVAFATTPTGAASATTYAGKDNDAALYVEQSAAGGFYAVAAKLKSV